MRYVTIVTILPVLAIVSGCGDPLMEGVAIGLGTSTATQEAQEMAEQSKASLVAKILELQQALESAASPEEVAIIKAQLADAQQKQQIVAITETVASKVREGVERDWDKPASPDNLAWILGSVATVLGGVAGKKTLDDKKKAAAIARAKIASKPPGEQELYQALDAGA